MKTLSLLIFIFASCVTWAQGSSDVPPPPMPEYMKKHNFKAPPPPPKAKLQSLQMDLPQKEDEQKETKFLVKDKNKPKVFLKKEIKKELNQVSDKEKVTSTEPLSTTEQIDPTLVENQEDDEDSFEPLISNEEVSTQSASDLDIPESDFEKSSSIEQTVEKAQSDYLTDTENEATPNPEVNLVAEKLADVEDLLESKEQEQENLLTNERAVAGTKKFKAGMYKFNSDCTMRADASSLSGEEGKVRAGQKLWIDSHDTDWHKVYKKSGAVFISADCLK